MKEYLVRGATLPEAYHKALCVLKEESECGITIEVMCPQGEPRISRCFPGGSYDLRRYEMEMLDGIYDFAVERGLWHYTYYERYGRWLEGVLKELRDNPDSRRACISVRDNGADEGSEDPACLQHMQFQIRDGKLDMYVTFRSNDAVRAAYMNAFALTRLQEDVAGCLDVPVGRYIHRANNFHCYPESRGILDKYIKRIESGGETTYRYKGDWEKAMNACTEKILDEVRALKRKGEEE